METFADNLLRWYDRHARVLPWRIGPKERAGGVQPDPYHVWLSEVMLQQTTVATVRDYFLRFIDRWPTVRDLAGASEDAVMQEWAGLGYYSRARNLKACADRVVNEFDGRFPQTYDGLKALPGIGDYTAAAIAAIAFNEKAAVVDGNIERVVTRYMANETPLPKAKADCRAFMEIHTPAERPGDFAQAMMDLGATICTPRKPACGLCPVRDGCEGSGRADIERFPVKAPKKAKPERLGAAFVIQRSDGSVYLVKRPAKGLLGGMAGVPTTGWTARQDGETGCGAAPFAADWSLAGTVRHTFTHFHLELEVWRARHETSPLDGWWSPPDQLPDEALPTVMRKVIDRALES